MSMGPIVRNSLRRGALSCLLALCLAFAGCVHRVDGGWREFKVFCGMSCQGGEVTEADWRRFCDEHVTAAFPDGYTFQPGTMVQEFESAVQSLAEYAVSDPVETAYGYHVIMRLPLDPDGVIEYSSDGTAMTARSKAANEAYGAALQSAFESVTVDYAEGFEAPNLLDYLK